MPSCCPECRPAGYSRGRSLLKETHMSTPRIIKKYPNRRLYDTEESRYITLADVKELVIKRINLTVIDKRTGDDITRSILLQVISEQESQGEAIMSEDFLSQVIRSYGKVVPDFMANYLEQSLKFFLSQQKIMREQLKQVVGVDPIGKVADMTQKNLSRFKALQDEVLSRIAGASAATGDDTRGESVDDTKKAG